MNQPPSNTKNGWNELSRQISEVGHDLNNMISAMIGNIELLRLDLDTTQYETSEELLSASMNARKLTRKLMNIVRSNSIEVNNIEAEIFYKEHNNPLVDDPNKTPEYCPEGTENILLVDDDASVLRIINKKLLSLGYHVTISPNGEEAVEKILKNLKGYDLIITDQNMPVMTGMELARKIAEITPSTKVMMLTGGNPSELRNEFGRFGFKTILQKPIDIIELSHRIRSELDDYNFGNKK